MIRSTAWIALHLRGHVQHQRPRRRRAADEDGPRRHRGPAQSAGRQRGGGPLSGARRVAVTGLGVASAVGVGIDAFWGNLCEGRSGIRQIRSFDPANLNVKIAGEIECFEPSRHFSDTRLELLDRFSQLTLVAAAEACAHAGLEVTDASRHRTGVSIGTALGGAITQDEAHLSIYERGRAHPFAIPRMMHNAAASQLTMEMRVHGPTLTHSTACAAAAHAIGEGAELIRSGRADVMLVGGSDAPISFAVLKGWESMRVAPAPSGDPSRACRPSAATGKSGAYEVPGFSFSKNGNRHDGAAPILAELAGYGATADAGHDRPWRLRAPSRLRWNRRASTWSRSNATHGTGTRLNDSTETRSSLRSGRTRTRSPPPTKSMHGHAMGASAALELIASILTITHGIAPPTANYSVPDPDCDLDYIPNESRELATDVALSNSFAFGGLNVALVVKRTE